MSNTKHTSGPWEARTFLVKGGVRMGDTICHVGTSTSLGPSRSNESEANARLIAAAPDLLQIAYEAPYPSAYHGQNGFEVERYLKDYEAWAVKRRAVIAKASQA